MDNPTLFVIAVIAIIIIVVTSDTKPITGDFANVLHSLGGTERLNESNRTLLQIMKVFLLLGAALAVFFAIFGFGK